MKNKKKRSSLKFRPIFAQNQVKNKKKGLHSNFVPVFAQNQVISIPKHDAQLAKGGGASLNFAHFSAQFCNPGDPNGGPWPNGPPKYAPGSRAAQKLPAGQGLDHTDLCLQFTFNSYK